MKKTILLSLVLMSPLLFNSCGLLGDEESTDPEKTLGKPGYIWYATVDGFPEANLEILENIDGMVTAKLNFDNNNFTLKGKITDNSISDFVYSNGDLSKPFTLVRFDAKVGDRWEYNIGNKKVVREVDDKSADWWSVYPRGT